MAAKEGKEDRMGAKEGKEDRMAAEQSSYLRQAIEKAGKFPERLGVGGILCGLEDGEWRQLIPFIEQNHNLRELDMKGKFIRKKVITLNSV